MNVAMKSNIGIQSSIGNWNDFPESIQQTASDLLELVNAPNNAEGYKKITSIIDENKNILELIFFESSINLYQTLLLDALIHWYDDIINSLSKNNAEQKALLDSYSSCNGLLILQSTNS